MLFRTAVVGCWLWTGNLFWDGYGAYDNARVHRITYKIAKGTIPEGLCLDHLCRVRRCCNPEHIEVVTWKENILRGLTLAADEVKRTHCPKGHPLEGDNLERYALEKEGKRKCNTCKKARMRKKR